MQLYNLQHPSQLVSFQQALKLGLGKNQGLFFPKSIPKIKDIALLLELDFVAKAQQVLGAWLSDEIEKAKLEAMINHAFNFDLPLKNIDNKLYSLELFHGPTLAFKDFGARFMAQCLTKLFNSEKQIILTATSGDTGAAVADAFFGINHIDVVILYPKGKISQLQEKMFTTLGSNIHALAIDGDFDACQRLVKLSFDDQILRKTVKLNSANSINISRLLAQICYYFEAVALFKKQQSQDPVISVPCGNFGDLSAGLLAKAMGLPIKRFIVATNQNDTIPRYLDSGRWQVKPTISSLSNAMDVSNPNNWPRVEAIFSTEQWPISDLSAVAISESQTIASIKALLAKGYLSEPHTAIAAAALEQNLTYDEKGIFLGTAHPAKFSQALEHIIGEKITLPKALKKVITKPVLAKPFANDFTALKAYLLTL